MPHRRDRKRRLFVAALLPPEVEADLAERLDPLRSALPGLRWVQSGNWHITIEFIGGCGPYETDRQIGRWADRARLSPTLEVSLSGAGTFPQCWRARVLWAGVGVAEPGWRQLAGQSQTPHVTVARCRKPRDLTKVVRSMSIHSGPPWRVEQIALMQSLPGQRGPRYEPVEVFSLDGHLPSASYLGDQVSQTGLGPGLDAV